MLSGPNARQRMSAEDSLDKALCRWRLSEASLAAVPFLHRVLRNSAFDGRTRAARLLTSIGADDRGRAARQMVGAESMPDGAAERLRARIRTAVADGFDDYVVLLTDRDPAVRSLIPGLLLACAGRAPRAAAVLRQRLPSEHHAKARVEIVRVLAELQRQLDTADGAPGQDCVVRPVTAWTVHSAWWFGGDQYHIVTAADEGPVFAMAALPQPDASQLLVTGNHDSPVRIWDPVTAQLVRELDCGGAWKVAALPRPDGTHLVVTHGVGGTVQIWDPVTGELVGAAEHGHDGLINALITLPRPDGTHLIVTGGEDGTVRICDPATGELVGAAEPGHDGSIDAMTALPRPDGTQLIVTGGRDGTVRICDPATGEPVGSAVAAGLGWVSAVAVLPRPDGRPWIVGGGSDRICLLDATTGQPVGRPLTGRRRGADEVAVLPQPDGQHLLVTSNHYGEWIWDPATGIVRYSFDQPGSVHSVTVLPQPDGRRLIAFGDGDGRVRIWDAATATPVGHKLPSPAAANEVETINTVATLPRPDGRHLVVGGGHDGTLRIWDPVNCEQVGPPLTGHTGPVTALAILPRPHGGHLIVSGSADTTVRIWDPATGQPVGEALTGHDEEVRALAVAPLADGRHLIVSGDHDGVRLGDPADTGPDRHRPIGDVRGIDALAVTPDGRHLIIAGYGSPEIWDCATFQRVSSLRAFGITAVAVLPRPDGRYLIVTGTKRGFVQIYDPATGERVGSSMERHETSVTALAVVPQRDGRHLIASGGYDRTVRIWDPTTGATHRVLTFDVRSTAIAVVPRPDGRHQLVTAGYDAEASIWDPALSEPVERRQAGHAAPVRTLTIAHAPADDDLADDWTMIATADAEDTVWVWDPDTGEPVGGPKTFDDYPWTFDPPDTDPTPFDAPAFADHPARVTAVTTVSWHEGPSWTLTGNEDGTVRIYDARGRPLGQPLTGHTAAVWAVTALPDRYWGSRRIASASLDGTIVVWDDGS